MDIPLNKKYKYERQENFDEFLKEIGANFFVRKMAGTASSTVELTKEGDTYTFHTYSTLRSQAIKFQPGIEFILKRMDGTQCPCVITFDGNKMTQVEKNERPIITVRIFTENEMYTTSTIGDVEARRWFKAV